MKKLLEILLLTIVLCSSCCCGERKQLTSEEGCVLAVERVELPGPVEHEEDDPYTSGMEMNVVKFRFEGHDYLYFQYVNHWALEDGGVAGIVHDPNCPACNGDKHSDSLLSTPSYESIFDW